MGLYPKPDHHYNPRETCPKSNATIVARRVTWPGTAPADVRKMPEPELGGAQAWAGQETPKREEKEEEKEERKEAALTYCAS